MRERDRLGPLVVKRETADKLRALVDDPDVVGFFTALEGRFVEEMIGATAADDDTRRHLSISIKNLRSLRAFLSHVVADGARAETQLAKLMRQREDNPHA